MIPSSWPEATMPEQLSNTPATPSAHDLLSRWIAACLEEKLVPPSGDLPVEAAEAEGVLPWLAYRLHEAGVLSALSPAEQEALRHAMRQCSLVHLDSEAELERLANSAAQRGLRLLAFKGHSVARTLYPHPACRPTSDFDLLIDPVQVALGRQWISELGYSPLQPFVGTLWLGAQSWASRGAADAAAHGHVNSPFGTHRHGRFHSDLHWDYSNRMYFRHRLGFAAIWAAARELPCGSAVLHLPCPVDDLILACVHLAAFDRGLHVRLIWLVDIYLLMARLNAQDIGQLLQRAAAAHALEACLACGEWAAQLGDAQKLQAVLQALRGTASPRRQRAYHRTLRWRAWDLACYWGRLEDGGKLRLFSDMLRWARVR